MIKTENGERRYYDRNGHEITAGCHIRYPSGREEEVYATDDGELGTDATNPLLGKVWTGSTLRIWCISSHVRRNK